VQIQPADAADTSKNDRPANKPVTGIKNRLWDLLASGLPNDSDLEQIRKIFLLNLIILLGSFFLMVLIAVEFILGDYLVGLVDFAFLVFLAGLFTYLRGTRNQDAVILVGATTTGLFFFFLIANGGIGKTAYVWAFTYPLITIFLLGTRKGTVFALALLALACIVFALDTKTAFFASYNLYLKIRFIPAYITICLFAFTMEKIREIFYRRLQAVNEEVEKSVEQLQKANAALEESEEKYRTILEEMEEGYYEGDLAGNFTFFNDALCHILGYSADELMGMNYKQYRTEENARKVFEAFNWVYRTGESYKAFDWEVIRKDGSTAFIETSVSLIRNPDGIPTGFKGVARDITEKKKAEAEKARLETQILQSQKLESVGRLAGGVAHDLNNLLSPILGYGDMLLKDLPRKDRQKDFLEEMVKAGQRAQDLVGQLLAFSRKQVLEFKALDLNSLLQNFEKLLRRTIKENIAIDLDLTPALPMVKGDRGQLEQIIMNLAVNAQDAMPDGGRLTLKTAETELDESYAAQHQGVDPGSHVMLMVADTGCGMDTRTRENIFEPFFTTKEKGKGTGLGLATVYGIVKQHGGNVWVYSEPGMGSAFKIYLPVPAEPLELHAQDIISQKPTDLRGTETVLLVEDNQQVRELAFTILEYHGYTVLSAGSGQEALALLENYEGPIDLLLTDVVMPGMDGSKLYEQMRQLYPNAKALYMSGYTEDVIAHHGVMDAGVNFIQKPFTVKALSTKVREVINQSCPAN
jgi:PAS domain S-box-containing protein